MTCFGLISFTSLTHIHVVFVVIYVCVCVCVVCVFQVLDSMVISADSKQLAEATYMKKKMYYNMRIKTLKRNTTNVVRKALEAMQGRTSHINLTLNVLLRQRKDIQRELEEQDWLPPMPPGQSTEVDLAAAAVSALKQGG